ncbi:SMI1/KNR4 family protein [Micromonospora sp. NPDC049836]|uniref:SMI1/KNR4 family protein n=1 Tax=Micromonospora sp. NPDC049836 TaxID=3364274 RepID=UPI0037A7647C
MTDVDTSVDADVADAWARIETDLGRVLPASLSRLAPPADGRAIDAVEAALGRPLPADFRASLRVHNGTAWGLPSPVPLDQLYDTDGIVEATLSWRGTDEPDPVFDDPRVLAHLIDEGEIRVHGPVLPTMSAAGRVLVGTMNGDVHWFLDLDPPPGGTPGQVVRADPESATWDVLAPSWRQLLLRYAEDLRRYGTPGGSPLLIDETGPACEWGQAAGAEHSRPAWLRDVQPLDPHA